MTSLKINPTIWSLIFRTNDLTNNVKLLKLKKVSGNAPSTNLAFSSIIVRKDKRNIENSIADTNARLKNFWMQKGIGFINNNNIKEEFLGKMKLHLSQRGNSIFAKNLLKYINTEDWINSLCNSDIGNEIFDKGIENISDVAFILKVGTSNNKR